MRQLTEIQLAPQFYVVLWRGGIIGHIARGQLTEQRDGSPTVRGRHWIVIGWEYQKFRSQCDAAEALLTRYRNLCDAHDEVHQVQQLESFLPYVRRSARRAEKKSCVKKTSRDFKRKLRQLRQDYRESMRRASMGHGEFNTLAIGGSS